MCTQPQEKKFPTRDGAKIGAEMIKARVGAGYQQLYPYECSAGGHWHLSHYRQGKARCPVCQLPRNAWRGGESYWWVISRHSSFGKAGPCTGTGSRVYDKGQTL